MKKGIVLIGMVAAFFCILLSEAVQAGSFFEKLLQVTGISATSGSLKGEEDMELTRDIILVDLGWNVYRGITDSGGYRSPVFEPGDKYILAMKGDALVRIPTGGGKEDVLFFKKRVMKLVGFDTKDADKLLLLIEGEEGKVSAGFLSLRSGEITALPL